MRPIGSNCSGSPAPRRLRGAGRSVALLIAACGLLAVALPLGRILVVGAKTKCAAPCLARLRSAPAGTAVVLGMGPAPLSPLLDRAELGAALFEAGIVRRIVASGGQGVDEAESEARTLATALAAAGVPPAALAVEERSTSTRENLAFSFALLAARGWLHPPLYVVTHDYHAARVQAIAASLGVEVEVLSTHGDRLDRRPLRLGRELLSYWKWTLTELTTAPAPATSVPAASKGSDVDGPLQH